MNKSIIGSIGMLLLSPDAAEGSVPTTSLADAPFIIGDNVKWQDDAGTDYEGTILALEGENAFVEAEDGKKYKVKAEDLSRPDVTEEVLEIKDGIKFIKKSFAATKAGKANPKNVVLNGYSFAAPRFSTVSQFITHVDARLKEQNKHKSQNTDKGVTAEEVILDNLHSMMDNKLRTRVKNTAQESFDAKKDKWNEGLANILFSVNDAYNWVPGIREPGAASLIKTLSVKIQEFQKQGIGMENPEFMKLLLELATAAAPK